MVQLIKNLHLLADRTTEHVSLMEHAALDHRMFNNLTFKVISNDSNQVVFQVAQGRNAAEAYHNKNRLIEIVNETFGRFFPDKKIIVNAIPYTLSPVECVNAKWITAKMTENSIKLKRIAEDTGIDYTQLSALTNGTRPLSQVSKAMFYFYFKSIGK